MRTLAVQKTTIARCSPLRLGPPGEGIVGLAQGDAQRHAGQTEIVALHSSRTGLFQCNEIADQTIYFRRKVCLSKRRTNKAARAFEFHFFRQFNTCRHELSFHRALRKTAVQFVA